MFGKSLSATGNKNSMKGTMTNTENGINLSKSPVVRLNYGRTPASAQVRPHISSSPTCLRSRLVSVPPLSTFHCILLVILISCPSNRVPAQ